VQVRQVVSADLADPVVETVAVEAADHLAERADVSGGGCQIGAVSQHLLKPDLLVRSPVVRVAQHPGGDLADLRRPEQNGWNGGQRSKRLQVCAHGGVAPGIAQCPDLGAQLGSGPDTVMPALVKVLLERIQDARSAVASDRQHILDAGGAGEATHGASGQAEFASDGHDAEPLTAQCLHRLVPMPGALQQPALSRVCRGRRHGCLDGGTLRHGKAFAVSSDRLLDMFGEVVP